MNIFNQIDYKAAVYHLLQEKKQERPQYTFEKLAQACGVQKTYLSRVLKHKGDLNEDQMYMACKFLKCNELETKYLLNLWRSAQVSIEERKKHYHQKLEAIRQKAGLTENHIKVKAIELSQKDLTQYFTHFRLLLTHMLLTISENQDDLTSLANVLGVSRDTLNQDLDTLAEMNLIKFQDDKWRVLRSNLHLPKSSTLMQSYRTMMRLKALEQMDRLDNDAYYSFSVLFSSEPQIRDEIQKNFLAFLKQSQALSAKGKAQSVYQMNFDLVPWS